MDEIRKQWAELMSSVGADAGSRVKQFTDPDVCKYYLTGLCPHDLFQNTKQYMGVCPNIHSDELRERYFEERKKIAYGYEEMSVRYLKPHVDECDRKIARQTSGGRCDTQDKASESIEASARREVEAFESKIKELMKEAETLGNEGNVEGSMKVMDEIHQLNMKKKMALEEKTSKVEEARNMFFQKLKPCEACGALLSEKDGENRLNEHFLGRIHLGFEAIRKHLTELNHYINEVAPHLPRHNAGPPGGPMRDHASGPNETYQMQRRGPPPYERRYNGFPQRSEPSETESCRRNWRLASHDRNDERDGGNSRFGRQPFDHRAYQGPSERRISEVRQRPLYQRDRRSRERIRSPSNGSGQSEGPEGRKRERSARRSGERRPRHRSTSRSRSSRRTRRGRKSPDDGDGHSRHRRSARHQYRDESETQPTEGERRSRAARVSSSSQRRLSELPRGSRERGHSRMHSDRGDRSHRWLPEDAGPQVDMEVPARREKGSTLLGHRPGIGSSECPESESPVVGGDERRSTPRTLTVTPGGGESEEEGQIRSQGIGSFHRPQRIPDLCSG